MKYHAAHILTAAKFESEDILRKIKDGADFNLLAQKFSTCSSAKTGGDLGEISTGKADPDFEDAVLKLKTGEISSAPVRTRFGYHIIKRIG